MAMVKGQQRRTNTVVVFLTAGRESRRTQPCRAVLFHDIAHDNVHKPTQVKDTCLVVRSAPRRDATLVWTGKSRKKNSRSVSILHVPLLEHASLSIAVPQCRTYLSWSTPRRRRLRSTGFVPATVCPWNPPRPLLLGATPSQCDQARRPRSRPNSHCCGLPRHPRPRCVPRCRWRRVTWKQQWWD